MPTKASPKAVHRTVSSCPAGQYKRQGVTYVNKKGRPVHRRAGCVKKRGPGRKSPKAAAAAGAAGATSVNSCPPGQYKRQGFTYVNKNGRPVRRPAGCVKKRGLGKKVKSDNGVRKIGPLKKGRLTALGYSVKDNSKVRRAALLSAVKSGKISAIALKKMLVAQANYRANAVTVDAKELRKRFYNDYKYLRGFYPPKALVNKPKSK